MPVLPSEPIVAPLPTGVSTPEGKVAIGSMVAGLLIAVLGGVVPVFTSAAASHPNLVWLQCVAILSGTALTAASAHSPSLASSNASARRWVLDIAGAAVVAALPAMTQTIASHYMPKPSSDALPTPPDRPSVKVSQ